MDQEIIVDAIKHNTAQQSRIADALEEILRLVKKDLEATDAYRKKQNDQKNREPGGFNKPLALA